MDAAARAAGIAEAADPTADPSRDVEIGSNYRTSHNPSRASLPLSHQRSFSLATSRHRTSSVQGDRPSITDAQDEPEKQDNGGAQNTNDIPWGPSHPCFPHLNPHVSMNSPLYQSTRIVRVKRDWMVAGDLAPAFSNLYPEILAPFLSEDHFWELIKDLNGMLVEIFNPMRLRSWFDVAMGALTGWLWDDFGFAGAKRKIAQLEAWLEQWNKQFGGSEGIKIIPLRRTGFMCLDIQIPDPQIEPEEAEGGDETSAAASGMPRAFSARSRSSMARQASSSRANSSVGARGGDQELGAHPVVPPIPGKYLEEAQQQVEKQQEQYREGREANEQLAGNDVGLVQNRTEQRDGAERSAQVREEG